jgi:hypothetical protein
VAEPPAQPAEREVSVNPRTGAPYPDEDAADLVRSSWDDRDLVNEDLINDRAPLVTSYWDHQDLVNEHPVP